MVLAPDHFVISLLAPLAALPWVHGFFEPEAVVDTSMAPSSYSSLTLGDVTARFPPGWIPGSADQILTVSRGDVLIGEPVVVVATTVGGRTENVTWLSIYRVLDDGTLDPVFEREVEKHRGNQTRSGVITVLPGGLVAQDPDGTISLWIYDAARGCYIEQMVTRPSA